MKSFKEFLNEEKYTTRPAGKVTNLDGYKGNPKKSDIIGWFSNKYNKAVGWGIGKLSSAEKKEFNPTGEKGIYRAYGEKGTSIIKIDVKTGKYAFIDNKKYEDGDIKFERMAKYSELYIDDKCEKYFL